MAKTEQDELQEIIDLFSVSGRAKPSDARRAIAVLARRLKALEDEAKDKSSRDS